MKFENRFDSLIQHLCEKHFSEIDWLIVKAQVWQESRFKCDALSSAGCMGLMQISVPLAQERLQLPQYVWCSEVNLDLGIRYLKEQYDHFPEIPLHHNKILFSLASYNCGRGYVNMALRLARRDERKTHKETGLWQSWAYTRPRLQDPDCMVRGKCPDWWQVLDYVDKIMIRCGIYRDNE